MKRAKRVNPASVDSSHVRLPPSALENSLPPCKDELNFFRSHSSSLFLSTSLSFSVSPIVFLPSLPRQCYVIDVLLAEPHLNFESFYLILILFVIYWMYSTLSLLYSSLSLSFLSPSLLPYLYMSRLRSLDLKKFCCLAPLTTPVQSTRVHRRGDPAGPKCTGTRGQDTPTSTQ